MAKFTFFYNKKSSKIFLRFSNGKSKPFEYFTPVKVSQGKWAMYWNKGKQRFDLSAPELSSVNSILASLSSKMELAYYNNITTDDFGNTNQPEPSVVGAEFLSLIGVAEKKSFKPKSDPLFVELFEKYKSANSLYSKGTIANYDKVINNLNLFKKDLLVSEITKEFYDTYKNFLVTPVGKGYMNETANNDLRKIKCVVKYFEDDYENLNSKAVSGPVWFHEQQPIFHTYEQIENFKHTKLVGSLSFARDLYCFACYCPIRISDLKTLNMDSNINVSLSMEGSVKTVSFIAKKNNKKVSLPINDYCWSIIQKYNTIDGKIFPKIDNSVINKNLKKAMKLSGFFNDKIEILEFRGRGVIPKNYIQWDKAHFHQSRHTFSSEMLSRGVDKTLISEALGHKDLSTVDIYSHVIENTYHKTILEKIRVA